MKPVQMKSIIVPRSIKLLERVYPVELNGVFSERVVFDSLLVLSPFRFLLLAFHPTGD